MSRIVYGVHPVREALKSGRVQTLFVLEGDTGPALREINEAAQKANVQPISRARTALDALAPGGTHQGVVAIVDARTARRTCPRLVSRTAPPVMYVCRDADDDPALPTEVSAVTTVTFSTPNSVRAICAWTVTRPWPTSAAAVCTRTAGSPPTTSSRTRAVE